jgi:probable O-glycosylation ligase (exosortase A-associated)
VRDLVFTAMMLGLLPLAAARPFVGVLLWCWFSFMNPHRELWGFAAPLPWAAIIFGTMVIGCVFAREPREWRFNAVTILTLALMVAITITSITALAPPAAVWAKWELTFKALLGLLITALLLTDRWRIHGLVWVIVLSIGYFSVKGGIFTLMTAGTYRVYGPESSMIRDNNHAAVAFLVVLPLMNYLRMHSAHSVVRTCLAAAMGLTMLSAVGSYSRGALIALVAVSAVFWWRSQRKLVGAVILGIALTGTLSFMPDAWWERMNSIATYEQDASATDRLRLWGGAWKLALDRPLVGSGFFGPYTRSVMDRVAPDVPARAIHSIWFEFLGEHGFPAFAIWFGMILAAAVYSVRLAKLAKGKPELRWAFDLARMIQVSIVAYCVGGTFLSLSYWDAFWAVLVIAPAAYAVAQRISANEAEAGEPALGRRWRRRPAPAVLGLNVRGTAPITNRANAKASR